MSSGTDADWARFAKLQASIGKLVLDGRRTLGDVANSLQRIIDTPSEKFAFFLDLGIITVPEDYDHATWLDKFGVRYRDDEKKLFCTDITDANFPNPSRVLMPGDRLRVRIVQQVVSGTTTFEECMAFLVEQNAILAGAQGASLVLEQMHPFLLRTKRFLSFDEKDRLWNHQVPYILLMEGKVHFDLSGVDSWNRNYDFFLCFCDVPLET